MASGDEVQVDPARLHEAGAQAASAGVGLGGLKPTAVHGSSNGWSRVEPAITAGVQVAAESLSGLAGHTQNWADSAHASADAYASQDEDNSAALGRAGAGLPGGSEGDS